MATSPHPPPDGETGHVSSADGTTLGYYRLGIGRPVVLVHGAGQSSENFRKLATYLAGQFSVFVPDRRGRGMSPDYGSFAGLSSEIADLGALLDATGARGVFGLSSGAVVAIETALVRPDIERLALYEPPLSFDGVQHAEWLPRYERQLAAGRPGAALAAVLKATADRGPLRLVPAALLGRLLDLAITRTADRPPPPGTFSPRELVPTLRYDARTVLDAAGPLERFASLRCDVLLLGGKRSAPKLRASLDGLAAVLPAARRVTFSGVGHTAADNSGKPAIVAEELRAFFT